MVVNPSNYIYSLFIVSVVPVLSPSPLLICEVERQNTVIVTLSNLKTLKVSFIIFVAMKISHLDNTFY